MTVVRPQGEYSAAQTIALRGASPAPRTATRQWITNSAAALGVAVLLGLSQSASAVILTGGPNYALPGGGSCTVTGGTFTTIGGGATVTCIGISLASHTKVYIGLRVDQSVNGNTMTGADAAAASASVFRLSGSGASNISYTSTTPANSLSSAVSPLNSTATSTLNLLRTAGTATVVATGGNPADSANNGDIGALFQVTSASITFDVDITAARPGLTTAQASTVYDNLHGTAGGGGEHSRVDMAFYWSDCGDSVVDSPEQCDQGTGVNGTPGSCCSSTCTFKANLTACTDDGNVCTNDQCNGASQVCMHPNNAAPCTDGTFCNGPDTCSGGSCTIHSGNPCDGPDGDGDCSESCDEGADNCTAADPLASPCTDGIFCNGTDTCSGGVCNTHTGDPCPGPNGDTNCSESCDEGAENCLAADPDGSSCRPAAGPCDQAETCATGACPGDLVKLSGTVCNPGSGDLCDPDEVCDGSAITCPADTITPGGTNCRTGSGDSCDPDETCTGVANAPCPPDVVESSSTVCRTGSGDSCDPDENCPGTAALTCPADVVQPALTVCRSGSGDVCDPDEVCSGAVGDPCPADTVQPPSTLCRPGSGDVCDPDEFCPGVPAGSCAAQVIAPNTTVCRLSAGLCDIADTCTGVAGAPCPADAKEPVTTECREAADNCDLAETCDGSSDNCPADVLKADGDSCSDGQFCNGAETCQSGTCTDQADPCILSSICNEGTDMCQTNVCPAAPEACRTAQKSLLLIKNKDDNSKDKLIWKFIKGDATTQADFGDPTDSADYALCIYEGVSQMLAAQIHVPPGPNWGLLGTKGYKYFDAMSLADGTQKVIVKGTGVAGKTKALLKGRGTALPDPIDSAALQEPVIAQLFNYQTGICWQGTYPIAKKNTTSLYKAKQ